MGAYIRVKGDRYIAGFVLIDNPTVAETQSFPAPPDESQAGQLGELYARASDLIGRWGPELFALKISELQKQRQALVAHRAEGVVLGAVGRHRGVDVTTWSGRSLWKPAGLDARAKNPTIIATLCSRVSPEPSDDELRQAAAAAIAALASES